MQKVKSLTELFQEVKDFDLVLTTDSGLKEGLNRLKEGICITPLELIKESCKLKDEFNIAIEISNKLHVSLKIVQHALERINHLWWNLGSIEKLSPFLSLNEKTIVNELIKFSTTYKNLEEFDFKELMQGGKVAVIAEHWFSELEKVSLFEPYTKISMFKEEKVKLSEFLVFNSHKDIIDRLTELITKENQEDVAIIVPKKSPLSALIESKLINKGIKISQVNLLRDHFGVRLLIGLIEIGFELKGIKVKEILPYLEMFDLEIKSKFNNYMFSYYMNRINKDPQLEGFFSFINAIKNKTYSELALLLNGKVKLPKEFHKLLKDLSLNQETINFKNYSDLIYALENFDLATGEQKEGVSIVDTANSSFVNKPLCFFLGLDNLWLRNIISKEGVNVKKVEENDLEKFKILTQQGRYQFYFVSEFTHNQNTIPCYYFNLIFNTQINSFLNPLFVPKKIKNKKIKRIYSPTHLKEEYEKDHLDLFSQSSFNNFVTCSKKYAYNRLLPQEEQTYFLKGNLLHEFAEFYFEHKEFVNTEGIDTFVKIMINKYKRINGDLNLDFEQSLFTIAVKNIIKFIDSLEVVTLNENIFSLSCYKERNIFAQRFNKELKSKNTEATFSDKEFGIRGIIDLIVNNTTIVDYKTSSFVKSPKDIIKNSNFNISSDNVDFQPSFYISELRKHSKDKEIKFIYNFILANKDLVVGGKDDKSKNIVEVKYVPLTFNDFLCTKQAIALLALSKDRSSLIAELKDYNILIEFFKKNKLPANLQYDIELLYQSEYAKKFHDYLKEKLGERYGHFLDIINSFLKAIVWLRIGERQKQALIFKEDIDEFEIFLKEKNKEINLSLNTKFKFNPINRDVCKTCDFRTSCLRRHHA